MNPNRKLGLRVSMSLAAAGLVGACWIQPALSGEAKEGPLDPEAMALDNWRAVMAHSPAAPEGCFHARWASHASIPCAANQRRAVKT